MKVTLLSEGMPKIECGCLIVTDRDVYTIMAGINTSRELNCYMLISLRCGGAYFTKFNNTQEIVDFIQEEELETIKRIVPRNCVEVRELKGGEINE